MTELERFIGERQMADIAAHQLDARLEPRAPHAHARAREHRVGTIDADHGRAVARYRHGHTAGPTAQLEDRPIDCGGMRCQNGMSRRPTVCLFSQS